MNMISDEIETLDANQQVPLLDTVVWAFVGALAFGTAILCYGVR